MPESGLNLSTRLQSRYETLQKIYEQQKFMYEQRDMRQTYLDQNERVEVERRFSLAKRKCNLGKMRTKLFDCVETRQTTKKCCLPFLLTIL